MTVPVIFHLPVRRSILPTLWDLLALLLVTGAIVLLAYGAEVTTAPLETLDAPVPHGRRRRPAWHHPAIAGNY